MMKKIKKMADSMLSELPDRSRDIITRRYGLKGVGIETLDSIGKTYGITRERVRQIESVAKKLLKKTDVYEKEAVVLVKKIREKLDDFGGILKKDDFFENILVIKDKESHNHMYFIIDITDEMDLESATRDFHDLIYTKKEKKNLVQNSIKSLYKKLGTEQILSEQEIVSDFLDKIEKELEGSSDKKIILKKHLKNDETLKRFLKITKKISSNELGGWGRVDSRNIVTKGIKDLAYLTLREVVKPLHFKDIVKEVKKKFNKEINAATCHNELIRDDRFILIGRGIYGLTEWGKFDGGTVLEVIEKTLKEAKKPLTKKEVIERVLEKKQVMEQTIAINLGNKNKIKKNSEGKYELI